MIRLTWSVFNDAGRMQVFFHQISSLDQNALAPFVRERRVDVSGVRQNVARGGTPGEELQRDQHLLKRVGGLIKFK